MRSSWSSRTVYGSLKRVGWPVQVPQERRGPQALIASMDVPGPLTAPSFYTIRCISLLQASVCGGGGRRPSDDDAALSFHLQSPSLSIPSTFKLCSAAVHSLHIVLPHWEMKNLSTSRQFNPPSPQTSSFPLRQPPRPCRLRPRAISR